MMAITVLQRHKGREALSVAMLSRHNAPTQVGDRRERVFDATPASLKQANARGFSLIEVLFAVLILTMGMIFVAMQFPVGLANSRKITNETLKVITTHNAKIMMELQLGAIITSGISNFIVPTNTTSGPPDNDLIVADGNVHLLPKVNLLNQGYTMIVDDPEDMLDLGATQDYINTSFYGGPPPDDFLPPYITINESNNLKLGNLGQLMSPAVTSSDVEVVDIVGTNYDPTGDTPPNYPNMNQAIFDVSLTRQYSWCALYKSIGQNNIRFYIFTLRKGTRSYAMQQDATVDPPEVFPLLNDTEDRVYPVPWLVDLNDGGGIPSPADNTRNFIDTGTNNSPDFIAPREFFLEPAFFDLFQEGTIFIDADTDLGLGWESNGYMYEVMEVTAGGFLRLRTPLQDDLNFIWIVPPAVIGGTEADPEFGEVDPVVDVAEQVIRF